MLNANGRLHFERSRMFFERRLNNASVFARLHDTLDKERQERRERSELHSTTKFVPYVERLMPMIMKRRLAEETILLLV